GLHQTRRREVAPAPETDDQDPGGSSLPGGVEHGRLEPSAREIAGVQQPAEGAAGSAVEARGRLVTLALALEQEQRRDPGAPLVGEPASRRFLHDVLRGSAARAVRAAPYLLQGPT